LNPRGKFIGSTIGLFWAIVVSFVAEKFHSFLDLLQNPTQIINAFLTSELPTESNFAFQFGMFFIVFFYRNKKMYALLALLMLFFSFKRIAIAGVLVFLILFFCRKLTGGRYNPAGSKLLLVSANCVIVSVLFLFFAGTFDELIEQNLGVSSNFITQGRYNIYQDIFAHFGKISLWGFGLGAINDFLSAAGYQLVNLHSDVLKIFFEFGPLTFVLWIYLFHYWSNTFLASSLAIYVNILFFTDNVFIYFDVMFIFYILMLHSFDGESKTQSHSMKADLLGQNLKVVQ
jgi:hypothetical protein